MPGIDYEEMTKSKFNIGVEGAEPEFKAKYQPYADKYAFIHDYVTRQQTEHPGENRAWEYEAEDLWDQYQRNQEYAKQHPEDVPPAGLGPKAQWKWARGEYEGYTVTSTPTAAGGYKTTIKPNKPQSTGAKLYDVARSFATSAGRDVREVNRGMLAGGVSTLRTAAPDSLGGRGGSGSLLITAGDPRKILLTEGISKLPEISTMKQEGMPGISRQGSVNTEITRGPQMNPALHGAPLMSSGIIATPTGTTFELGSLKPVDAHEQALVDTLKSHRKIADIPIKEYILVDREVRNTGETSAKNVALETGVSVKHTSRILNSLSRWGFISNEY